MSSKFDPNKHRRRSIRLPNYDYAQPGAYYVTIVASHRECWFGEVVNGEMRLNRYGEIVADTWQWLERQYSYVELGAWVVMPNHFHGILIIHDDRRGGSSTAPTTIKRTPLGRLIGAFKTVSTKNINLVRDAKESIVWQRNYYEHVIRNDKDLQNKTNYVEANPMLWNEDDENPLNIKL